MLLLTSSLEINLLDSLVLLTLVPRGVIPCMSLDLGEILWTPLSLDLGVSVFAFAKLIPEQLLVLCTNCCWQLRIMEFINCIDCSAILSFFPGSEGVSSFPVIVSTVEVEVTGIRRCCCGNFTLLEFLVVRVFFAGYLPGPLLSPPFRVRI